jgi:hypothetical protein
LQSNQVVADPPRSIGTDPPETGFALFLHYA